MIVLNHNNRHFAFILSSFLAALSTAGILMYDDYLDDLVEKKFKKNHALRIKIKVAAHILVIFLFTLCINYLFYNFFEWAPAASWTNSINTDSIKINSSLLKKS